VIKPDASMFDRGYRLLVLLWRGGIGYLRFFVHLISQISLHSVSLGGYRLQVQCNIENLRYELR
jgi:hypothetical protein